MDELWHQLTRGEPTLRWWARRQSDGNTGGVLHSPQGLGRLIHNLSPQWDMYFNINSSARASGVRVSSGDITHWRTVLLDIDPTTDDSSPMEAAREYMERAFQIIGQVPAMIVDSGRGVQVHLHLTPRALGDTDDRMLVRRAVGSLLRRVSAAAPIFGCKLDLSCSDLARVARMPLTINHKTGRPTAVLCSDRDSSPERGGASGLNLADTHERILALAESAPLHKYLTSSPPSGVVKYQQVWSRLTRAAQEFLTNGAVTPGRHVACVAAVKSLQENGVSSGETTRVVVAASDRCTPPLELRETLRIVRQTYA